MFSPRTAWRWPVMCLAVTCGFMIPARATQQTITVQQGLNGYTGARDTWVSRLDWDTPLQYTVNYGWNESLILSRDAGDNPLLRFDLTAIPANSEIISAELWLYNTEPSSYDGAQDFARRVRLFRVLRDWDEGNQVNSPVDAAGKHGATGDHAFDYYPGEGSDVPWAGRGMTAGQDYLENYESYADVVNAGWYAWDLAALARGWVRGEYGNHGLVLRDATGYADNHRDWRTFVSSQATDDPNRRPKLVIVYDPDVPLADAGPDQTDFAWDGGPIWLDGSGSHDRPGGDDQSLQFRWEVRRAAFGSSFSGEVYAGTETTAPFTPDHAGEWELELTVTNNVGAMARDTVSLRLLRIPATHPRIYLDGPALEQLRDRAIPGNPRWAAVLEEADDPGGSMLAKALVGLVSGQDDYCDQAVAAALDLAGAAYNYGTKAAEVATVYDWCHHRLSAGQRNTFIDFFNAWGDNERTNPYSADYPGWGNYWPRYSSSFATMGLASFRENPRAQEWLDEYRYRRFGDYELDLLDEIAAGGAWPEGMVYDWIANPSRVKAVEAWRVATGEDLFRSTDWFRERFGYLLLHRWPGLGDYYGHPYHPYVSTGDSERNRASLANYERIMALILIGRFPDEPLARQLQAYLAAPPTDYSLGFVSHEEFLWFDPETPAESPSLLTHYAAGTGTVLMRSGWPDGAADTSPVATCVTFQCGDHYSYHQHYDQNSFTLWKRSDLAIDSGVYSGDGLSDHDINYYVRTIAHNTLVVYNPAEDFSSARPDATSIDGGQRTLYPASRSPQSIEYFNRYRTQYETGDITRFEDTPGYTYILGDATAAYNNPAYCQAMDTALAGNTAKVSRFAREFVYLRPAPGQENLPGAECVFLLDRVGVTDPAYSGANTKLLFHTVGRPEVLGTATPVSPGEDLFAGADSAMADWDNGRLYIRRLLPATADFRRVGGRAQKAFWVFGLNHDWHWDPSEPQPRPVTDFDDFPYGEWRLELEPADTGLEHAFLTVLFPTDTAAAMPEARLVEAAGMAGAHLTTGTPDRLVLAATDPGGAAPASAFQYAYSSSDETWHLILDLPAGGSFRVTTARVGNEVEVEIAPDGAGAFQASPRGTLEFIVPATPAGDLDGDGLVTALDLALLAGYLADNPVPEFTAGRDRADLDGDGRVTVVDLVMLFVSLL